MDGVSRLGGGRRAQHGTVSPYSPEEPRREDHREVGPGSSARVDSWSQVLGAEFSKDKRQWESIFLFVPGMEGTACQRG